MHYYSVDGCTFESKLAALDYGQKNNQPISFYYHDDIYSKVNWSVEPPESLDYYYREQAQRLRDKYDYLILCYSGGYDSTNILETFHFNNIKLDKIVIVGALSQDSSSGVDENHNGELYHNAFPYIKELGLESITQVCDYTDFFNSYENFSVSQYGTEWVDYTGAWFSPHNWFWRDIGRHVIPKNVEDKKVGLIFGKDKPYLITSMTDPNYFGFSFRDVSVNSYGNLQSSDKCDIINFYWDKDYPEILVKQLHILKRSHVFGFPGYDRKQGVPKYGKFTVNKLIYNLRKPLLFKSPKSKTNIISLRDNFLNRKKDSVIYNFYMAGIERLNKVVENQKIPVIQGKIYLF